MKNFTSSDKKDQYFRTEHLKSDLKVRSVRGGAITLFAQGLKFVLNVASNIVLARLLTPGDYGLVGMVTAITGFVTIFRDLGLSMATVQKEEINHEQVSTLFWVNIVVSIVTSMITVAIAPMIAQFYNEPRLTWITIAISSGFIISGLGVQHQALLNRQMQYKVLMTRDILSMVAGIASAIAAALYGLGYWALVISPLVTAVVGTAGLWIACSWRPGLPARKAGVKSMLVFGSNLTGFNVVNYFARNLDNVLIGRVWGAQQLGLYAKAYQLLLLPLQQINAPVAAVAIPALSRLVDSPERYRQAYLRILEKLTMVATPLVIFMIATSDWIIQLVLGPQWSEASPIFSLLGIIALTQPVSNTTGWLFITQGRTSHMFQWGIVGSILSVIAIIAGLPWGATGVAASYSISGLLIRTPLLFWYVGRSGSVKAIDLYRTMAPSTLASVCSLLAILCFRRYVAVTDPLIGIMFTLGITTIINLLILSALPQGRKSIKDLKYLITHLHNKKKSQKQL
ncbi:lipopolysaccharide biosynthesis protein [Fortiea sp. LEGE XX443]|uniref:lipopolysaccharide biosynthesis protein n=1 Tax=Fortiea sp. LEGE XX443 TaxID=1828611 RepID=UPI00187E3BAD|nr:lipopolysaccharide biosynthesis protein [Fortiea sp. LEGE XX443]MBE9004341.1 lipopolysaccharide biosynthesis protein [Fortiea sp. LEGE XX443]